MRAIGEGANGGDGIVHVSDEDFDREVLRSELPVLVDFWAAWCGPCRSLGATLERVAPEVAGRVKVVKVNVDESAATSERFGIRSIPTMIFFDGGEAIGMLPGAIPREPLRELLERHARHELRP